MHWIYVYGIINMRKFLYKTSMTENLPAIYTLYLHGVLKRICESKARTIKNFKSEAENFTCYRFLETIANNEPSSTLHTIWLECELLADEQISELNIPRGCNM